jgi:hypothetical protein
MDISTIKDLTRDAVSRLVAEMKVPTPFMAQQADAWIKGLAKTENPADYFHHPLAFPMLLFPMWVEKSIQQTPNVKFQGDLVYSSINGYYFIRMIDNVMDEHSELEIKLLPMVGFFYAQFYSVYQRYFPIDHPFWEYFAVWNAQSSALAIEDTLNVDIDLENFRKIAGKKVVGAKIPLVAVLHRYDRLDLLEKWDIFYDRLSCWHQMFNDMLTWNKDLTHNTASYFLSEGNRQKKSEQSIIGWLVSDGLNWGFETLMEWFRELMSLAETLDSPDVIAYLNFRKQLLEDQSKEMRRTLDKLALLVGTSQS